MNTGTPGNDLPETGVPEPGRAPGAAAPDPPPGRRAAESAEPGPREAQRALARIREDYEERPEIGMILGTGIGGLADEIDVQVGIPYGEIPGFPVSTVETHAGRLLLGTLEGKRIAALDGRFHRYEGWTLKQVTFPIRVLVELGVDTLIVTAACGGMHPLWKPGDLVLIADHINLMGDNPLVGPNWESQGPRFPDMSEPYEEELRALAREEALSARIPLREGVYVAVTGPNLETAAEYRMLRRIGADVVGMSTVPEVIVAKHAGMRVLGVAIITDACLPDALEPAIVEEIIATAQAAEPELTRLLRAVIARI